MAFQVTIVGLDRIGASIGLALKSTSADILVVGHDKNGEAARQAQRKGSVDRTHWNLVSACEGADLVLISTPMGEIRQTLEAVGQYLKPGCVVTDTAPLKVPVLLWAESSLSSEVSFVGGHPILFESTQTDHASAAGQPDDFASPALLEGVAYCLTPGATTPPVALQTVANLVQAIGARPYYLDAAEHDGLIAAIEGLPLSLALVLQKLVGASPSRRELHRLTGAQLRTLATLLQSSDDQLVDLLELNAENNSRWMEVLLAELSHFHQLLRDRDRDGLRQWVQDATESRDYWSRPHGAEEPTDYSDFGMGHMMLGDVAKPRKPREG